MSQQNTNKSNQTTDNSMSELTNFHNNFFSSFNDPFFGGDLFEDLSREQNCPYLTRFHNKNFLRNLSSSNQQNSNNLSSSFFSSQLNPNLGGFSRFVGQQDVVEHNDKYTMDINVAGIPKENMNVTIQNNILTVKGQADNSIKQEKDNFTMTSISSGSFHKSFRVPNGVDLMNVRSKLHNGILTVIMQKLNKDDTNSTNIKVE